MPETPPPETPPPPSPPQPPQELQNPQIENPNPNPNLNFTFDTQDPPQKSQLLTQEIENPLPENNPINNQTRPEEEEEEQPTHVTVQDQEQEQQQDEPDPDPETENPDQEGINNITQSPLSHNYTMSSDVHSLVQETKSSNHNTNSIRRTSKRKKGGRNHASKVAFEKKMQLLLKGLNPIPFKPGKSLDFSRHEELLRKLGLWDFAHVEFDRNVRVDLIGKLIVNYNAKLRRSDVNGFRIMVSRADLGRALKLPLKKFECDVDVFPGEFLSFLEEFVSNWMLLHEDLWCMPSDMVNSMKMIEDGSPQKVDWAGMIWYMVEKELGQGTKLKDCYYASHLQQLIKVQREELLRESPTVEVGDPKVEVETSKEAVNVEDDEEGGDVKMMVVEESGCAEQKLEQQSFELRLGEDCVAEEENVGDADKVEKKSECLADETEKVEDADALKEGDNVGNSGSVDEINKMESFESAEQVDDVDNVDNAENPRDENKDVDMMDFGDYKVEEQGHGQWFLDGKIGGQHFLQRCTMDEVKVSEGRTLEGIGEEVEDDEAEEDGHVEGFKIMQKSPLGGVTSTNLMQAFGAGQLPYSSTELGGQSSLELMSSRAENNVMLGGPSMFNHAGKREIDHENDISHHALSDDNKRIRLDGNWDHKSPDFDMCMDHIQQWIEKAKICHVAGTDYAYQQASMAAEHIYVQQLAQKENEIEQWRYKFEDLQRRSEAEMDRRDRELYLMSSVIDGYRRALKQNQKTFAEFRKRHQVPDEPIYKDAGLGVVKSVMQLERERLKQEEENKMMCNLIEETFKNVLNDCEVKWDGEVLAKVESHQSRLVDAVKETESLKDYLMKHKASANVQADEPEGPSE